METGDVDTQSNLNRRFMNSVVRIILYDIWLVVRFECDEGEEYIA